MEDIYSRISENKSFKETLEVKDYLDDRPIEYAIRLGDRLGYNGSMLFASYFYTFAIDKIIKRNGKNDKQLIDLYLKNSKVLRYIGKIEESYQNLNMSIICTLNNYSYTSLHIIECLINFHEFSMFIW